MPYKTVGRVGNATKDIVIGVCENTLKVYSTGVFENAIIKVFCDGKKVYEKIVSLSSEKCFTDNIDNLKNYKIKVIYSDMVLCEYEEYIPKPTPIPEAAEELKKPKDIASFEELFLAGQDLEQYRHAMRDPSEYYLEGLHCDDRISGSTMNTAYCFSGAEK